MKRQCLQRLATASQFLASGPTRSLLLPSLTQLRPSITAQRLSQYPEFPLKHYHYQAPGTDAPTPIGPPLKPHDNVKGDAPSEPALDPEELAAGSEDYCFVTYAAWHPKNRSVKQRQSENRIPYWKRTKVGKVDAGEDAFFQTYTPYGMALGVADGVGGWADVGVDPALFSWTLMNNAACVAKDVQSEDAHHILDAAFHELCLGGKVQAGSSTACILNLCKSTGKMTTCNLGDSAFLLIRDKKIIYESPSQQHYFNCPYQLTILPETYPNREMFVTDMPKDADQNSFFLKDGDIILLATDGYFDNVYPHETLAIVNSMTIDAEDAEATTKSVRSLVKLLTDTARRLSLDRHRLSPWAREARAHGGNFHGGKVDDITCIVTLVQGGQANTEDLSNKNIYSQPSPSQG